MGRVDKEIYIHHQPTLYFLYQLYPDLDLHRVDFFMLWVSSPVASLAIDGFLSRTLRNRVLRGGELWLAYRRQAARELSFPSFLHLPRVSPYANRGFGEKLWVVRRKFLSKGLVSISGDFPAKAWLHDEHIF